MLSLKQKRAENDVSSGSICGFEYIGVDNTSGDICRFMGIGFCRVTTPIKHMCLPVEVLALIFTQVKQQYENNATTLVVLFNYNERKPLRSLLKPLGAI